MNSILNLEALFTLKLTFLSFINCFSSGKTNSMNRTTTINSIFPSLQCYCLQATQLILLVFVHFCIAKNYAISKVTPWAHFVFPSLLRSEAVCLEKDFCVSCRLPQHVLLRIYYTGRYWFQVLNGPTNGVEGVTQGGIPGYQLELPFTVRKIQIRFCVMLSSRCTFCLLTDEKKTTRRLVDASNTSKARTRCSLGGLCGICHMSLSSTELKQVPDNR